MSPEVRALFLGIAVVLFVAAAVVAYRGRSRADVRYDTSLALVAAGLAVATFPFFWDAWDLATS